MLVLDFLFNICYSPFQKVGNGRFAALIWLAPPLTFISVGLIHIFLYYLNPIISIRIAPIIGAIGCFGIFAIIFLFLNKIYVKGERETGKVRFPLLCILLILVMMIGSITFFALSLYKFR